MLNISKINLPKNSLVKDYSTLKKVENKISNNTLRKLILGTLIVFLIMLFLPWTQNIKTTGSVTTLKPNQKPQNVTSIIGGQVSEWFVQEGDFVKKGDTILKISEVKDAYFDKNLLPRTENQIALKKLSIVTYGEKSNNYDEQLLILKNQRDLKVKQLNIKLRQATLKVQNDSIANETALVNFRIANYQLKRADSLYNMGYKSLTELEAKKLSQQKVESLRIKAENTWLNGKTELLNIRVNIANTRAKYEADFNKTQSLKLSTINNRIDAESNLNKLENQYSNYDFRNNLYYITAPQTGFITKMKVGGIGETIKPGQEILTLMPKNYDLAVQIFIDPVDLPLITYGQKVRIQFDGWPAIVFSGWPNASHGTYGGEIYAIDQFISQNGKYRVLVKQDSSDYSWPNELRFGGGTSSMIMLNDVPIWYELWRNINGFPPDFYKKDTSLENGYKTKNG